MQGSDFRKKVRDARAEGAAAKDKRYESILPTPPGLSIVDAEAAAPSMVAFLEQRLLEIITAYPEGTHASIFLTKSVDASVQNVPAFVAIGHEPNPEWWVAICRWGTCFRTSIMNSELAGRYKGHVSLCVHTLRDMWNRAHPETPVSQLNNERDVIALSFDLRKEL